MVLSTLALVGIIQLFLLLAGGIFFLFLHTRFLKKQIRELRGETQEEAEIAPPAVAAMTESSESEDPGQSADASETAPDTADDDDKDEFNEHDSSSAPQTPQNAAPQMEGEGYIPVTPDLPEEDAGKVTGEIAELRKMLNEKLLLTANLRKLIEGLLENPDSTEGIEDIATQQNSSLLHLEEYIKLSRKEAAAVEEKIIHYREQLAKAKKLLNRYKEQHAHDLKQLEEEHKAREAEMAVKADTEKSVSTQTGDPEPQAGQSETPKPE